MRRGGRTGSGGWAALAILAAVFAWPVAAAPSLETAVKATYLYKFAPFVVWPEAAGQAGAFDICVVGRDPFGDVLDKAVAGQAYGGRAFRVVRIEVVGGQSGCDIAYLGGSARQSVAEGLQALKGAPVLTVTDGGGATGPNQGMIAFAVQDGHVRFHIDQAAAVDSGLNFSSKLLSLALSVKPAKAVTP